VKGGEGKVINGRGERHWAFVCVEGREKDGARDKHPARISNHKRRRRVTLRATFQFRQEKREESSRVSGKANKETKHRGLGKVQ